MGRGPGGSVVTRQLNGDRTRLGGDFLPHIATGTLGSVTPLTPALSPLRGEGVAWWSFGQSQVFARACGFRVVGTANRYRRAAEHDRPAARAPLSSESSWLRGAMRQNTAAGTGLEIQFAHRRMSCILQP
jgi:hypothetical protein